MKYSYDLGQEHFDALMTFFSADRDEAGEKYEQVRRGLVRFFHFNGCDDGETLADETINRVASRLSAFDPERNVKPTSYFYGFASNILMEYRRKAAREETLPEDRAAIVSAIAEVADDAESSCLDDCLEDLPGDEKNLVVKYYSLERREKIELRRTLCEQLNLTAAALYTRIFRIKSGLKDCIETCLKSHA
jgi:DNA-directed RNA polymerase specialized sigma24 family protein